LIAACLVARGALEAAFCEPQAARSTAGLASRQQVSGAARPLASASALQPHLGEARSYEAGWNLGALCVAGLASVLYASATSAARASRRRRGGARDAVKLNVVAGVKIIGTGSSAPETVVSNNDLAEIIETNDEWIVQRTGIRTRHVLRPDETLASMAATAAKKAMEKANISAEDIDMIILATSSPDDLFGSATAVAAELGATNAVAFDITAACSGFVFAFVTASQYIRAGAAKNIVVIGADCLSRWVDWSDRGTCILFGDGAGAVVVTATDPDKDCLIGFQMGSDGNGRCSLGLPTINKPVNLGGGKEGANGAYGVLGMNGNDVFRFATGKVPAVLSELLQKHNVEPEEVDWLLLHQANRRIMDSAAKKLMLPQEKILCNLDEYGNTSAGSIPLALDEAVRSGKVKEGDLIASMGFGAGLSWGGILFRM